MCPGMGALLSVIGRWAAERLQIKCEQHGPPLLKLDICTTLTAHVFCSAFHEQ